MNKIFLGLFLGLLLLSIPGFSENLYQYSANIEIFSNNTAHYKLDFVFIDYPKNDFSFSVSGAPYDLSFNTTANCTTTNNPFGINVSCSFSKIRRDRIEIIVEYNADNKVEKRGSYMVFSDSFKTPLDTTRMFTQVALPEGYGLIKSSDAYSPTNAFVGSLLGRQLLISWQREDFKAGESLDVSVAYEKLGIVDTASFIWIGLGLLAVAIAGIVVFYKYYKKEGVNIILPILKQDEKLIFEAIMKHGSGVNQKIIVKETNYSKAKVSKVLKSLQERGVLKLERIGRTNKVHIVKGFENKTS